MPLTFRFGAAVGVLICGILLAGCSRSPTAPSQSIAAGGGALNAASSHGLPLIAVAGTGSGTFNLTITPSDRNGFTTDAQLAISVRGVAPNTVLYLQRAGDRGLPGGQEGDGVCQRAAAGLFAPVPGGATLATSPGGAGATHVHMTGTDADDITIDAVYRLVDALPPAIPTVDFRTPCFTFTLK
jgi:hypothetical protein